MRILNRALLTLLLFFGLSHVYKGLTNHQQVSSALAKFEKSLDQKPIHDAIVKTLSNNKICTAWVISSNYMMTAGHCAVTSARIMSKTPITIFDSNSNKLDEIGEYAALDMDRDLALIAGDFRNFKMLKTNTKYKPVYQEKITACGYPHGHDLDCINSRYIDVIGNRYYTEGEPVVPGMSGGPMYNSSGEVIGIINAYVRTGSLFSPIFELEKLWGI